MLADHPERSAATSSQPLVAAALAAGVRDSRVLAAIAAVDRSAFVPPVQARRADEDVPLPIPHGLVTTQPSLLARMVAALGLAGRERVLEVGTGYGYQTALLARLAGSVYSVERFADLAETARGHLARAGLMARVHVADGSLGLPEHAPYDAIVVAAAFPEVPPALVAQLVAGGRLVQPIGAGGHEEVIAFEKVAGVLVSGRLVSRARFVRLVGAAAFAPSNHDG